MTTAQEHQAPARDVPSSLPSRADTPALTQSQTIINQYVTRAGQITEQLTDLYTQLAFDKGSELRVRKETFEQAIHQANITTAREEAHMASVPYQIEILKTQGEIDGLILALQHCDRVINHWNALER